ncbi:MMPL family transporter [Antrihabitans sp. NCIMB 15449]|uniref:MMPL family transporter n=1 Tax=Antrihabitans spumae TaxID=3373370 RepID=A0ABW7JR42_9NOCA
MLVRVARLAVHRPRIVLVGALIVAFLAIVFGASAADHLKGGGFIPPDAESTRATNLLNDSFHGGEPNLILLITTTDGVDSNPAARAAGDRIAAALRAEPEVSAITSYWEAPANLASALRSKDGLSALVTARVAGDDNEAPARAQRIVEGLTGTSDGVTVRAGGFTIVFQQINSQITKDLAVAEAIAIPLTLLLLIWVFGSVVAALLPLLVGLFAIVSTLAILRAFTLVTDVSIFSLNMTTAMGLALAIDYSLFIVSRYREELERGLEPEQAVFRSVQTAGRTVFFSALTVALSLAALAVFPQYFLKSFAYAGLAVVGTAALASILVLPAALVLLGRRVNALDVRVWWRRRTGRPNPTVPDPEQTLWYRGVTAVMRRAAPVAVVVIVALLFLGAPFLNVKFGSPDDRVNTADATSRQVGDIMRTDFAQDAAATTTVVLPDFAGKSEELAGYATALSKVDGVTGVLSQAGVFSAGLRITDQSPFPPNGVGTYLSIGTSADPFSDAGTRQIDALRAIPSPGESLFTGAAAQNEDTLDSLGEKLPLALGLIALTTFVLLFLFTGSVVLPLKALVLNTLSLTAAFGAMVWIFQEGHLSGLLDFTATGFLVPTMPILMFCIAFGMSMDYEVFLLSRIREEWLKSDRTDAANTHAVALGVARTGRIITAAAGLMAIVFFAMTSANISFIQLFGLGLTITVLADATLIRSVLAPAFMQLLGRANWWAPKPLVALHKRIGLEEEPPSR